LTLTGTRQMIAFIPKSIEKNRFDDRAEDTDFQAVCRTLSITPSGFFALPGDQLEELMMVVSRVGGRQARTRSEVAKAFGVAEETVKDWRRKGMPGKPGSYDLAAIFWWRRYFHPLRLQTSAHLVLSHLLAEVRDMLTSVFRGKGKIACAEVRETVEFMIGSVDLSLQERRYLIPRGNERRVKHSTPLGKSDSAAVS